MLKKADYIIPIALLILSVVPTIAGLSRLSGLIESEPINQENARFFTSPVAVGIHIIASLIYGIFVAFQFSKGIRSQYRNWHRMAGRFLILAGFASVLTGLYLTIIFPKLDSDGPTLFYVRMIVGIGMTFCIAMAIYALQARRFNVHGEWMIRSYAIGLGAGTQVITHLPWIIGTGELPTGLQRDAAMAAGWLINYLVAEIIIYRSN